MKKEIHPTVNPVVFLDSSCGAEFVTTSTLSGEETRNIDGVEHQVVRVEISSASHPFYTGKQVLLDTARRVEKFEARQAKMEAASENRKGKKAKVAAKLAAKAAEEAAEEAKKPKKAKKEEAKEEKAPVQAEEAKEEVEAPATTEAPAEEAKSEEQAEA